VLIYKDEFSQAFESEIIRGSSLMPPPKFLSNVEDEAHDKNAKDKIQEPQTY
jgi:hypothetical protein